MDNNLYKFTIDKSLFYVNFTQCGDFQQISFSLMNHTETKKSLCIFNTIYEIFCDHSENNKNTDKYIMFITPRGTDHQKEDIDRRVSLFQRWFKRKGDEWEFITTDQDLGGRLKGSTTIIMIKKQNNE